MAESIVQVTEGSGKKLHTWSRTIGANTVEDEAVFPAEYPLASYVAVQGAISIATANDHLLEIMAGASLNVRIRRILIRQRTAATTAAVDEIQIWRLSTAGTGGTAVTPAKMNTADAASGATAMALPTVKGTETTKIQDEPCWLVATTSPMPILVDWRQEPGMEPIIIPAGTTNGIAIKGVTAIAAGQVTINVWFVETSFV